MEKVKHDKYQKVRSGKVKRVLISCANCGKDLFIYQKDGDGSLHRCYFNRIIERIGIVEDGKTIKCSCESLIGVHVIHLDKRDAYKMMKGNFHKDLIK